MAVVDGGGVMLQSRASGKHILRFSPELILVERLSVKTTDWSIDRRSLTRCEIGAGLELILRRTNNKIRRVQLQTSVQSSIYNVKLIGDDSVVVLASERDTAGSSIFCQTTKGDVWFKAHLTFAHHLDAGSRWVCASNDRGEGLLVHLETKRTFPFDTRDGKASSQRRSYFIDESQASGDELVEIDRVTRIVRRFAMPKVSASPESAPAVK
jgi:hypothetical protein